MKKIITIIIVVITLIGLASCAKKEETVSYGYSWEVGSHEATLIIARDKEEKREYETIVSNIDFEQYNRLKKMYENGKCSVEDWFYLMFADSLPEDAVPPEYIF